MKTLTQIREASGGKEAYQKFFNSLLKKFGVKSPSELKGDKKKEFFDAIDKGWESDDPNDKNERYSDPDNLDPETSVDSDEDLADKAASQVTEALKPGKGNIKDVGVDLDATDYPGGEKAYVKDVKKKFKVSIKLVRYGADLSGKKADIIKFLQSDMYGGVEDSDIEDMWPALLEDTYYPKALSIIRLVKEFSGDAETVRRKRRRFESEEEEAHKMNEKIVDCEDCGKMHEEGACGHMNESEIHLPSGKIKLIPKSKWAAIKKKYNVTVDSRDPEWVAGHPNDLYKWATAKDGLGMSTGDVKKKYKHITPEYKGASNISNKQREDVDEGMGKNYPVMNAGQRVKIIKIAKKNSGDMEKAIKLIDKIRKGLSDNPDVMDILKKANEDVNEAMSKGELKHDKEFMHKKLKGNKDKSMVITTIKALDGVELNGRHVEWSGKVSKLLTKHKVSIRNDRDGDVSVWGSGNDVNNFLKDMGHKAESVKEGKKMVVTKIDKDTNSPAYQRFKKGDKRYVYKEQVDCDGRLIGFKAATRRAEGEKQKGSVIVDRRTKGYREAQVRKEKAAAKRLEAKKAKAFAEKYPKLDYAYGNDAELKATIEAASKVLMGETAANNASDGKVDMAPNMGKKKKEKLMKRGDY